MEDIDEGFDDGEKWHIPNKPLWKISCMIPMSRDAWRTAMPDRPSAVSSAANGARYILYLNIKYRLQEFLRGLGYMGYGGVWSGEQLVPSESSAVLGGIAEMGRHSEAVIDPEYGAHMGYWTMITDLPLAPDPPVDAGIFRFCHSCRKCADACPSQSISQDSEPTWEVPNFDYKVQNMNNNPGKKLFWTNCSSCVLYQKVHGCCICRPVCTFNVNPGAMIHEVVKGTIGTMPLLNSFFANMSKPFGYGLKNSEEWWDLSLPTNGIESTVLAADGGYRK
jgi:reductive dehalogenase